MPRALQQGDEPVRGYRLVKYLGKGSFGEVWQASGPGGTEVAFKSIRLDDKPDFNLHTIELIKKIKHPNLVPMLAMWLHDAQGVVASDDKKEVQHPSRNVTHTLGEFSLDDDEQSKPDALYIAMGLGEKSLTDRFKECKEHGEQGIPTAELIGYFEDAARAIDHLNSPKHDLGKGPVAIPHCDIKPQNILIVGGAAQVCDFGLARVLGEMPANKQSGTAIAFSAPELIDSGKPSSNSDQYSLAITYHYLRTGALPFSMTEANVVLTEALEGRLDLSRLTTAEQQVIRRATSRRPEARFANCQDLTRELRRAIERSGTVQGDGLVIEPNREIVPGHKLVSLIGRGAYGEVWEAQAPGRLPIALKIIKDLDRASGRGKQEFRALEIIQNISHNALMELRAYWLLDRHGQVIPDELRGHPGSPVPATLIIATRLADKNLTQVMEKYHEEGKPGIPVQELLGYLRQVANGVDYLNQPKHRLGNRLVSIQHRDVKPDNIMIANDAVKLTDFGLAKVLETDNVIAEIRQDSVGFTFHYAAPEVLRGKVTKWSDQYSLAITYFQLRTGQLPYGPDCSAYDQMMRQLEGELDLSPMLTAERNVVARATSVVPEERFPSCYAFMDALAKAVPPNGELLNGNPERTEEEFPRTVTPVKVNAAQQRRNPPSGLTTVAPPVKSTRDQPTMQAVLGEGEIYPHPIKTPHGADLDTDHDASPTKVMPAHPAEASTTEKPRSNNRRFIILAMVFAIGIAMAVLVHQFLKDRNPELQAHSSNPAPTAPSTTERNPGEFMGPIYEERRPNEGITNVSSNKPNETVSVPEKKLPTTPVKPPDLISPVVTNNTPPVPPPVSVLGKVVTDPDFPNYLQTNVDRMIASNNQPVLFTRSLHELEQVPAPAVTAKLQAFRAECLIEGEAKNLAQADMLIKQAQDLGAPTAYTHYVQARIWQELRDPVRAVASLEESLKYDVSLTGFRRERALSIFNEAAQRVNYTADARNLTSSLADPVPSWFSVADRFIGKSPSSSLLAVLMAIYHPMPKDPTALQGVLDPAIQDEWSKKPQGPVVLTSLRLKMAESAVQAKQAQLALNLYADSWAYIQKHRDAFDATSPLVFQSRILGPAQKVAAEIKPNTIRNTQLATVLAGYAGLIYDSPYEAWPIPSNKPALRFAAEAYGEAAKLYPSSGRIKAEYLTGQGQCLNRLGSLAPGDIAAITTNATAATSADPTYAGGWNIMGLAKYYRLTQESSAAELRRTLTESVEAYDKAIRLAEQVNQNDRQLAQYRSNRSLAKSMLGDFTPVENNQRQTLYQDAIADALKATQIDNTYESAWGALGQARERLADLLEGIPARTIFAEAVTAYRKQLDARPSLAQGYAYLGRCLIRWALDENKDAQKLDQGRDELNKAIKLDADLAEAHFWLGRYYLVKNDAGRAIESFLRAINHADLGNNFLNQTMAVLNGQPLVLVPLLNQYLPTDLSQCQPRHAVPLIARSSYARRPVSTDTPWSEAKPTLERCISDAQTALKLTPANNPKQRADALEAIATARLMLFAIADDASGKTRYRTDTMADIRALLKADQATAGVWELAFYQAKFLDQDAVNASEDQAKAYRQEAISAVDVAISHAPAAQKDQLRRLKSDIQSKLRQ